MSQILIKRIFIVIITFLSYNSIAQDKYSYVSFDKLLEVEGTEFVVATIENLGKMQDVKMEYLLFINAATGQSNKVEFPKDASIRRVEQIKIDSLGINLIAVSARTVDLDGKSGIDWNDPLQVWIISPDGKEKKQLTDERFYVRTWTVNDVAGTIVIAGHYDLNKNNKYDKTDKNEIHIYDLRSLQLLKKL